MSPAWYYLIRIRPRVRLREASGSLSHIARMVLFDTDGGPRGPPRGRPREAAESRSNVVRMVLFDTDRASRPASRPASRGCGVVAQHRPRGIYLMRTRPRGQPRTASGSRFAIARVVLFDTELASRPAIVRLGHMQEVFLREPAVSWIRLRRASTVPSKAWLETKGQYICQQAQRGRGRLQCAFGCRGSLQQPPKAARSSVCGRMPK